MKNILLFGAGRSSSSLIQYLLEQCTIHDWLLTIVDKDPESAFAKTGGHPKGIGIAADATVSTERLALIRKSDLVISLLPPAMHLDVANDCLASGIHFLTASYMTTEMRSLHSDFQRKNILFMGEMGLDPGIDHMSAMQIIHQIQQKGGKITSFTSYCGGLVAPESDDNPWHYKFTWNPRNVVLAGQGTAQFLEKGLIRYLPYHRLFREFRHITVPGMGQWEVYANRDSLLYQEAYGLKGVKTLLRGTIRHTGFCEAWNLLVQLGMTDHSYRMHGRQRIPAKRWLTSLLPVEATGNVRRRLARMAGIKTNHPSLDKLEWLGLFGDTPLYTAGRTPAEVLEGILLEKWKLAPEDKDMIIMHHEFEWEEEKKQRRMTSSMMIKGEDQVHTAMSKTVGLPLGILTSLILQGKIHLSGAHIPVMPVVYEPVLNELAQKGIAFVEKKDEKPRI